MILKTSEKLWRNEEVLPDIILASDANKRVVYASLGPGVHTLKS